MTTSNKSILTQISTFCNSGYSEYHKLLADGLLTSFLANFAGVVGNSVVVDSGTGLKVYPNLYTLIIGESGRNKSSFQRVFGNITSSIELEKLDDQRSYLYHVQESLNPKDVENEKKKRTRYYNPSWQSPEFESSEIPKAPHGVPENPNYTVLIHDTTIASAYEHAAVATFGNIFLVVDESYALFSGFTKKRDDQACFLKGYEYLEPSYSLKRRMRDAKIPKVYNFCMNFIAGLQPLNFSSLLGKYESSEDGVGMFARMQNVFLLPDTLKKTILIPELPKQLLTDIKALFTQYLDHRLEAENVFFRSLYLRNSESIKHLVYPNIKPCLHLSEAARKLFAGWNDMDLDNTPSRVFNEYMRKTNAFTLRVAALLHLIELFPRFPKPGTKDCIISAETLSMARDYVSSKIEIYRNIYYVKSGVSPLFEGHIASLLTRMRAVSKDIPLYKKLHNTGFTARDIYRTQWSCLPRKAIGKNSIDTVEVNLMISTLLSRGELIQVNLGEESNNKNTVYLLVPQSQGEGSLIPHTPDAHRNPDEPAMQIHTSEQNYGIEEDDLDFEEIPFNITLLDFLHSEGIFPDSKGLAKCPMHNDSSPSFHYNAEKEIAGCFTCGCNGGLIKMVMWIKSLEYSEACDYIRDLDSTDLIDSNITPKKKSKPKSRSKKIEEALDLWNSPSTEKQSLRLEPYLCSNRLKGASIPIPESLAFAYLGEDSKPYMLARIDSHGSLCGVAKFPLSDSFYNVLRNPKTNKKIISTVGVAKGGYVVLNTPASAHFDLILSEGIETGLSALAFGIYHGINVTQSLLLATLGASNIKYITLESLKLPESKKLRNVYIFADNDSVGEKSAEAAKSYWSSLGFPCLVIFPYIGKDFNDAYINYKQGHKTMDVNFAPRYNYYPQYTDGLENLPKSDNHLGIDVETTGLRPFDGDKICLLQISNGVDTVILDLRNVNWPVLPKLKGVAHNAVFETTFLQQYGIEWDLDCTMIAEHVLTGVTTNLNFLSQKYLNIALNKTYQKRDWSLDLDEGALRYAAADSVVVVPIFAEQLKQLKERNLLDVYNLVKSAIPAVAAIRNSGMPFDREGHSHYIRDLYHESAALQNSLQKLFPELVFASSKSMEQWVSSRISTAAKEKWDKTPTGQISVGYDKLKKYLHNFSEDDQKILKETILPLRKREKILNTFGTSLANSISPVTDRIHSDLFITGTHTGRFSCSQPNMQQVPKDPAFRGLFKPEDGYKLLIADYSMLELRTAAAMANEVRMLRVFESGGDLHKQTASSLLGKPVTEITKADRQLAKAVNFGLLYGQRARGFTTYAQEQYGISLTQTEAQGYIDAWFAAYPAIAEWQRLVDEETARTLIARTKTGRIQKYIRPSLGSTKDAEQFYQPSKAYNFIIQGTSAEISTCALGLIRNAFKDSPEVKLVMTVHDEFILETPDDNSLPEVAKTFEKALVLGFRTVLGDDQPLNGIVDVKISDSWADK